MDGKLPEEFAPTGAKLSKFPIRPAPPLRPRLFPDEARFALRLSIVCGCGQFAAWFWLGGARPDRALLALAGLSLLKPLWAGMGTRLSRPALARALLLAPVLVWAAALAGVGRFQAGWLALVVAMGGLPAIADLCATCAADSVTVERRPAAYGWLDMGQGLGAALGFVAPWAIRGDPGRYLLGGYLLPGLALLLAAALARELHDRGTPRSSWPLEAYRAALCSPLGIQLAALAFLCAALALAAGRAPPFGAFALLPLEVSRALPPWLRIALPLAGMGLAARAERFLPNAVALPRAAVACAAAGLALSFWPLGALALGAMFAALPAAVARGAGEMERPLLSSLAWSALVAGAALGSVV